MIPFPGEAVLVEDAADVTSGVDGTLWEDVWSRAGSRTLSAGDEWRAFVYSGDMDYLEETGLDLTVEWVVEVLSGSVTVAASEGPDPSYGGYTDPLGTSLGTHTLTVGENRIVSTFAGDDVADLGGTVASAFQLGLVATSGSAVVQQVKLYVWPAAGTAGAFVTLPGWESAPTAPTTRVGGISHSATATAAGIDASWDAAVAAAIASASPAGPHDFNLAATSGTPAKFSIGDMVWQANQTLIEDYQTAVVGTSAGVLLQGPDWRGLSPLGPEAGGVDFTRPPTEVRDEADVYLYPQTGDGSTVWVNNGVVVEETGLDVSLGAVTLASESLDSITATGSGTTISVDVDLIEDGTSLTAPGDSETILTPVALPSTGAYLLVHASHTANTTAPDYPGTPAGVLGGPSVGISWVLHFGTGDPFSETFQPIQTYAQMPGYKVWVPTAVETVVSVVRHYPSEDGRKGSSPLRVSASGMNGRGGYTSPRRWGGYP